MPVRPLIVAAPGNTGTRLAVEQAAREWGWRPAVSPAEANMLVLAGSPGETYVDVVWRQIPVPRARAEIDTVADTRPVLAGALAQLQDPFRQQPERSPVAESQHGNGHNSHDHSHDTHDHDMGEHDMGGHGMHGHHMGGMQMPGGIVMADRAQDRDGLKLDVLHVPLGPILADWPAGLVVHTTLQGDVVQNASVEMFGKPGGYWTADRACARRLDSCGRLLAVAGWESAAMQARRLRDEVLSGRTDVRPAFDRWARRVRRSRVLHWSLTGLGEWEQADAAARLVRWIDQADTTLEGAAGEVDDARAILDALPGLMRGCELAGARLLLASLDPDTDQVIGRG
ncbi:hypothetical protein [Kibdelosporangium persicum]|nr:hypothetical protein [Kibdelosporangium persicum]